MSKKPNFLFIVTDQHRADHLGCYGNKHVKTPNIDGLAARGVSFDRFYVANPVCMCNRASILTSRMPSLHGVRHNGIPLSHDSTTFVELLRDAGYQTALIGKSHIQSMTGLPASTRIEQREGLMLTSPELQEADKRLRVGERYHKEIARRWIDNPEHRVTPPFYGFDEVVIADDHADRVSGDYYRWLKKQRPDADELRGPQNAIPDARYSAPQAWRTRIPEELYSTSYIAGECETFLRDKSASETDNPFFLMMSFPDPHHPFTPPGKYWDMYDPDEIDLPASFGQGDTPALRALRKHLKDTPEDRQGQDPFAVTEQEAREIIALTYGSISMIDDAVGRVLNCLDEVGLADDTIVCFTSDHGDYMGDYGIMLKLLLHYQGLLRVPFIWADPTSGRNNERDEEIRSALDIGPTFLERSGIQPFNGAQGKSILNNVKGHSGLVIEEDSQRAMAAFDKPQRIRTYVEANWRISIRFEEDWNEMYDLRNDPMELVNLWDDPAYSTDKSRLLEAMLTKAIELQDRSPMPEFRA